MPEAVHFFRTAEAFLDTADREFERLVEAKGRQWEYREPWTIYEIMPVLFNYGHTIELTLKSFLLSQGMTLKELRSRRFGHDIHELYIECRDKHMLLLERSLMPEFMVAYFKEADWHTRFRYIEKLQLEFPGCGSVQAFAHELIEYARPVCHGANPLAAFAARMAADDEQAEQYDFDSRDELLSRD